MTTLYDAETYEPLCNVSQATAEIAIARNPGLYFYFDDPCSESITDYLADPDFLKIGGTD